MSGDLVRRLALMLELREWDGNTGRAARMALDACKDAALEIRSALYTRRDATEHELRNSFGGPNGVHGTTTVCRICSRVIWVDYRANGGSGSSGGSHDADCIGPEFERLADRLEWPTDQMPPRE